MTPGSDNPTTDRPTDRREFIGQIAATAIVLAGTACAPSAAATTVPTPASGPTDASPSPAPAVPAARNRQPAAPAAPVHWDDSWFAKITAKHKAVFDCADIDEGLALSHAAGYIRGMHDAVDAAADEVIAVVVIRHAAIPMIFNDAMWTKYSIGEERKVKKSVGDGWATRNEYIGTAAAPAQPASTERPAAGSFERPQATLSWLGSHGHILLGCDQATRGVAAILAKRAKVDQRVVYEDLKANLVPGVILQPTGVYAVLRAQEAGCAYIRST